MHALVAGALMTAYLALWGCAAEEASARALRAHGFTHIELDGYAWTGCSDSDIYSTSFTATNPQGEVVSGVVCCGLVKDCTVRF